MLMDIAREIEDSSEITSCFFLLKQSYTTPPPPKKKKKGGGDKRQQCDIYKSLYLLSMCIYVYIHVLPIFPLGDSARIIY